jgi:hypothetical protein
MNIITRIRAIALAFVASSILLTPSLALAQQPDSIEGILNRLLGLFDDNGAFNRDVYRSSRLPNDSYLRAFNRKKFGECSMYYILEHSSEGDAVFESFLAHTFAKNAEQKKLIESELLKRVSRLPKKGEQCGGEKYSEQYQKVIESAIRPLWKQSQQKQFQACKNSKENRLADIAGNIVYNRIMADSAKEKIKREDEAAKISGLFDRQVKYEAGKTIAEAARKNKELFEEYRKLGGPARSMEAVTRLPDPSCAKKYYSGF